MTHVITRACCNDAACVVACPVDCIRPTPEDPDYLSAEMLYIDPESCIDCGACVDVCPVGAISVDYDLAPEFARYEEVNARYFSGDEMPPPDPPTAPWQPTNRVGESLRVAVIGTGPAACYAAAELLSLRGVDVGVDMYERLLTPYGLVRFGVAPDHQDTKQMTDGFWRTLRRQGVRTFFGIDVGRDVTHGQLQERYHAVVYAVGASDGRSLGIDGEDLAGALTAADLVAWYNGHPDGPRQVELRGDRAVVVGNGNVALDVARFLLGDVGALRATDLADAALDARAASSIGEVVILGRRGPEHAAFTFKELIELADTPGFDVVVEAPEGVLDAAIDRTTGPMARMKLEFLQEVSARPATAARRVIFRFGVSPSSILGERSVRGVELSTADGGDVESLTCGMVIQSIGYRGRQLPDLPYDASSGSVPHVAGAVTGIEPGTYVTGWIKRGPQGVIGTNKRCARETVRTLLAHWEEGRLAQSSTADDAWADQVGAMGLEGWMRIDEHERSAGREAGRPRVKLTDPEQLADVATARRLQTSH